MDSTASQPVDVAANSVAVEGRTAAQRQVSWDKIRELLPHTQSAEDKTRRIALFRQFDTNNSTRLTYDEFYRGCKDILHLDTITTHLGFIVKDSFDRARALGNSIGGGQGSPDYVEFLEFRMLLSFVYNLLEMTMMFDTLDFFPDGFIRFDEFQASRETIKSWGYDIPDLEAAWKELDANGSGQASFEEFCVWAKAHKLDIDGDPNNLL
ncbi:EF-hand domain pair/EF hand/EF-hand domain containing protein [Novymonas esmeraldas]|uniref:EF-hand domain pair/EF hand/EF-hand domain containing protein n=1 Tax=Novymonas esmeraldas TaxID=1808958 RepID=A0AAW0EKH1_9TRYP